MGDAIRTARRESLLSPRERRAAALRPAVVAEFERLRYAKLGLIDDEPCAVIASHLREIIEELRPDGHDTLHAPHRSVEHFLNGHRGIYCPCNSGGQRVGAPVDECSGVPESWVLDGFEMAALLYPIADPEHLAQRMPSRRSHRRPNRPQMFDPPYSWEGP